MKYLYTTLFLLFITIFSVSAQDTADNLGIVFRVQVSASTKPLATTSKLFTDLPDVEGVKFPDGYIRYMTGTFESFFAAKEHLEAVKLKGYKDAYVTALQGLKRMTPDQAISLIYGEE